MSGGCAYKRPESVLVVVYAAEGQVLLLRRRQPPDFWQSVTGSLAWQEDPWPCARRELAEETGLTDQGQWRRTDTINRFEILPAWRQRYDPAVSHNVEYLFYYRLPEVMPVRLNPREHSESIWLPANQAATRASSITNRAAIVALIDQH